MLKDPQTSEQKDLEDARFYPSELNLSRLNTQLVYIMSFGKFDGSRYNKAKEYLHIAKEIFLKPENHDINNANFCRETIDYIDRRLKKGK